MNNEYILIVAVVFSIGVILVSMIKHTGKGHLSQRNVDHIEFSPAGPIFKTRLTYHGVINPTPVRKGSYSFMGFIS